MLRGLCNGVRKARDPVSRQRYVARSYHPSSFCPKCGDRLPQDCLCKDKKKTVLQCPCGGRIVLWMRGEEREE